MIADGPKIDQVFTQCIGVLEVYMHIVHTSLYGGLRNLLASVTYVSSNVHSYTLIKLLNGVCTN